jgi:hypothetical protein
MADGVRHEVWTVDEAASIKAYQDALAGQDVFIADGHHRYTTGLNYLKSLESQGPVPASHPARRCMMVLVGMSDPGLVIWPTHRVLGGMRGYSFEAFRQAAQGVLSIAPAGPDLASLELAIDSGARSAGRSVLGLYDYAGRACYTATFEQSDPLRAQFPDKPEAWRTLDVALIQHLIVDQVCRPRLNAGEPVTWAFPHTVKEVLEIGRGATPLGAVKAVSGAGELMPQKSTFFYPKLATGLWINPLE